MGEVDNQDGTEDSWTIRIGQRGQLDSQDGTGGQLDNQCGKGGTTGQSGWEWSGEGPVGGEGGGGAGVARPTLRSDCEESN